MNCGYDVYLGTMLLPVTPGQIDMTISNKNKTATLINDGEINLLKEAGLTDIKFTALLPQVQYPFARYTDGFIKGEAYLNTLEQLKTSETPFRFIVSRCLPSGKLLFDSNICCSMEDYKVTEKAKNGFDLEVEINLRQYRNYGTKTISIEVPSPTAPVIVEEKRPPSPPDIPPPSSSGGSSGSSSGGNYKIIKLTVERGGSIDGGNCALSKTIASPGESVTVLPRAKSGYAGDYFTYNGTKKSGSWTITPNGKVATIKILVYYKRTLSSGTIKKTAEKIVSTAKTAVTNTVNTVKNVINKVTTATKKTTTTSVVKKAVNTVKSVVSTLKNKMTVQKK